MSVRRASSDGYAPGRWPRSTLPTYRAVAHATSSCPARSLHSLRRAHPLHRRRRRDAGASPYIVTTTQGADPTYATRAGPRHHAERPARQEIDLCIVVMASAWPMSSFLRPTPVRVWLGQRDVMLASDGGRPTAHPRDVRALPEVPALGATDRRVHRAGRRRRIQLLTVDRVRAGCSREHFLFP